MSENSEPSMTEKMILNPLKRGKYRNKSCLCGSGAKVKVCCGANVSVPYNLGNFWINVISGDKEKAEFFAKAWEDDMKAAKKEVEASK